MSKKTFLNLSCWFLVLYLVLNSHEKIYSQSSNPIDEKKIASISKSQGRLEFLRVQNEVIAVQVSSNILYNFPMRDRVREKGLFNIGTSQDNKMLLFEFPDEPWSSHLNVKIDDVVYSNDSCRTDTLRLPMIVDPHIMENSIICTWQVNGVTIEQKLTPEQYSDSTGAILIQYEITNNDNQPHQVGLQLMMDINVDSTDSAAVATNFGYTNTTQHFVAPNIPDYFQAFKIDPVTPGLVAQGTLKGGKAVPPDVFIVGYWPDLMSVAWDYTLGVGLYEDSAILLRWNETTLLPGETKIIGTYYGVGEVKIAPGQLSLNVSCPSELRFVDNLLNPNPFFINLVVTNTGYSDARDVLATIKLPSLLQLTSQEQETKGINPPNNNLLHPDSSRLVSWQVLADLPQQDNTVTFSISVTSSNADSNSISRQVFIPTPYLLSAAPRNQPVVAGESVSFFISIANAEGYYGPVSLYLTGLPETAFPKFDPNPIDLSQDSISIVVVQTDVTTPSGIYPLVIAGSANGFMQRDTVNLQVLPPPDFILNVNPDSQIVIAGRSAQYQVSIDTLHGFDEAVGLTFDGLPDGAHGSWNQNSIRASEIAILTIYTDLEMPSGSHDFWVEANSSTSKKTCTPTLIVQGQPPGVIPNPFTPNGDGFNDFVLFNYPGIIANQGKIFIFNFGGKKIRELVGTNRWDGKNDDGESLSSGVYLYILKVNGKNTANGTITLVR